MTNAEPTSTDSTTEPSAKADNPSSLVAVSEENLAALLRATSGAAEPEVKPPSAAEGGEEEAAAPEASEALAAEPVQNPPVEAVDSRLALFAAVKEHRSEILRAAVTQAASPVDTSAAPVEPREYPAASLPPEAAPIQVTLPKSQPVIEPAPTAMPAPAQNRLVVGGIVGVLIMAVAIFSLWPKAHPPKAPTATAAAPKDTAPLQVLAEPLGNGLINVRWNAQSPVIAQARDGRLVITEREKAPRIMALDVEQLKIGHLAYQSTAESIQFDLEVNDRSGAVAKESILALSSPAGSTPRTGASPQTSGEQNATAKQQIAAQAAPPKVQTPASPAAPVTAEATQASPAKARTFVPPPTQQKREQGIIDAPPALANAAVTPLGVSVPVSLGAISPPPPGAPQQIQVESKLQAGNLIKRVVPVYPPLARAASIQGVVRFTALIGKDGRIQNLKLISGPSPLVEAARSAVKQWVYRPTLLNGQPAEVITEINVNFTLSGAQ